MPAQARSVVFVLDRSASMGIDDRLSVARDQIQQFLATSSRELRFQVVVYNRRAEILTLGGNIGLVVASLQHRAELRSVLDELSAEGGNDHLPALLMALSLQPDAIILVTDADDLSLELVRRVTAANRGRSSIHAVAIGSAPRQAMKLLAEWNHGSCRFIDERR